MSGRRWLFVAAALSCCAVGVQIAAAQASDGSGRPDRDAVVAYNQRLVWDRYVDDTDGVDLSGVYSVDSEARALIEMIAHHQDAIDAAGRFIAHAETAEAAMFAERIVRVQTSEVRQMRRYLERWYPGVDESASWQRMFCTIESVSDDEMFFVTMIGHHRDAVAMYRQWVADGVIMHDQFGRFVRRVGRAQAGEIVTMEQMLGRPVLPTTAS